MEGVEGMEGVGGWEGGKVGGVRDDGEMMR